MTKRTENPIEDVRFSAHPPPQGESALRPGAPPPPSPRPPSRKKKTTTCPWQCLPWARLPPPPLALTDRTRGSSIACMNGCSRSTQRKAEEEEETKNRLQATQTGPSGARGRQKGSLLPAGKNRKKKAKAAHLEGSRLTFHRLRIPRVQRRPLLLLGWGRKWRPGCIPPLPPPSPPRGHRGKGLFPIAHASVVNTSSWKRKKKKILPSSPPSSLSPLVE